jgi:hypothetical protein
MTASVCRDSLGLFALLPGDREMDLAQQNKKTKTQSVWLSQKCISVALSVSCVVAAGKLI